jgi:hypothetical protein
MLRLLRLFFGLLVRTISSRRNLLLENLALRQQIAVLRGRHPQQRLAPSDRFFWVLLSRLWPDWKNALAPVQPDTVVRWHRAGFKMYWKWLSRHRNCAGRRGVSRELRELIFRMVAENRTWGAPRIHGELMVLGFDISERTVLRWMRKAPGRVRHFLRPGTLFCKWQSVDTLGHRWRRQCQRQHILVASLSLSYAGNVYVDSQLSRQRHICSGLHKYQLHCQPDWNSGGDRSQNRRMSLILNGRGERIRTSDPLVPNQVRYQTALRPELC